MKKGYVRTLEAIIAILIIFTFIYLVLPRNQPRIQAEPEEIRLLQDAILNEMQQNATFRDYVLAENDVPISNYIASTLALVGDYDYRLIIDDVGSNIVIPSDLPSDKSVYADGVVIGSNLNTYSPKLVTVYIWE